MKKIIALLFIIAIAGRISVAQEWDEYKSQHFIVYYKEAPLDFVKTVNQSAERYYNEISRNLGFIRYRYWSADNRAQIYIYDSPEDFVDKGKQAHWSSGSASTRSKTIRTFPTAHGFFDSTLPHELGHIIFREFIGENTPVPLWFEEGVAMYQEKAKRWGAHGAVKKAMEDGVFMPLNELSRFRPSRNTDMKIINLFYAESASIVYYLIQEQGTTRFVRLCRKLKDGILFDEAFKSVYVRFKDLDDLNKAWEAYIKK